MRALTARRWWGLLFRPLLWPLDGGRGLACRRHLLDGLLVLLHLRRLGGWPLLLLGRRVGRLLAEILTLRWAGLRGLSARPVDLPARRGALIAALRETGVALRRLEMLGLGRGRWTPLIRPG